MVGSSFRFLFHRVCCSHGVGTCPSCVRICSFAAWRAPVFRCAERALCVRLRGMGAGGCVIRSSPPSSVGRAQGP
jgi:hypothetical protein